MTETIHYRKSLMVAFRHTRHKRIVFVGDTCTHSQTYKKAFTLNPHPADS